MHLPRFRIDCARSLIIRRPRRELAASQQNRTRGDTTLNDVVLLRHCCSCVFPLARFLSCVSSAARRRRTEPLATIQSVVMNDEPEATLGDITVQPGIVLLC